LGIPPVSLREESSEAGLRAIVLSDLAFIGDAAAAAATPGGLETHVLT
jgi:hypothetical protein